MQCRCWETTTAELQAYLGSACGRLEVGQLRRFVRAWHDIWHEVEDRVDGQGAERQREAEYALAAAVQELLAEYDTATGADTA
jgi:hypothetical protein